MNVAALCWCTRYNGLLEDTEQDGKFDNSESFYFQAPHHTKVFIEILKQPKKISVTDGDRLIYVPSHSNNAGEIF